MGCDERNMHEGKTIKGLRTFIPVDDIAILYKFLLTLKLSRLSLQNRFVTQRKESVKELNYTIRKGNKDNRWVVSRVEPLMQTTNTIRPRNIRTVL
jgi:hypothetical protein